MQPSCQIPLIRIIIIIIIALLGKHALTDNSKSDAVSLSITDEVSLQQQAHVGPFESGKEAFTMRIVEGQEQLCTTTGCYPREFQATNQFKPVLDGQLLPPGTEMQFIIN
jgi:hypothetical protein